MPTVPAIWEAEAGGLSKTLSLKQNKTQKQLRDLDLLLQEARQYKVPINRHEDVISLSSVSSSSLPFNHGRF